MIAPSQLITHGVYDDHIPHRGGCSGKVKAWPLCVQVVAERPSLLGLDADKNLKKIVEWMQYNEYSHEDIIKYLKESI